MSKEISITLPFLAIIVLAFVIGALFLSAMIVFKQPVPATQEIPTLDVTGTAKISVQADKVDIYLSVETEQVSALDSQQENADTMAGVKRAILSQGLTAEDIETTNYVVYPVREYLENGTVQLVGYRTTHQLKVKITDLSKTGKVIDAAVSAGVNNVNDISFGLTDAKYDELRSQILLNATANAKTKAEALAAQMGVKLVSVQRASEGYVSAAPMYKTYMPYGAEYSISAAPTDISAGQLSVTASMSISYKIG